MTKAEEEQKIGLRCSVTRHFIALVTDMPHLIKTLRNSLLRYETIDGETHRVVMYKKDGAGKRRPMTMGVLHDVWEWRNEGGADAGITTGATRLLLNFSRRRTRLSTL